MRRQSVSVDRRTVVIVAAVAVAAMLSVGCSKKMPQEVTDVNRALGQAKDACATVYAADDLKSIQADVDGMNALADEKKYKKAKKQAIPLMPRIDGLETKAGEERSSSKSSADSAIGNAQTALDGAKKAEAETYAASQYKDASAKLAQAKSAASDPCKYPEAAALANEAADMARRAASTAVAEKKRLEEERRLAEERRKREEEEARRRAEEERLRAHPPTYTVERGDSLWRISGMNKIYGNSIFWPIVYDANGKLIRNPDLIYPGQTFSIPRDLSEQQMEQKLKRLWRDLGASMED